jgi:transcriptional regulator with XRE-family HTH domain
MADYNERVAERIVNARERKGISAETLALRAGVSIKQMGRIESGKSIPRLSTIRKIADALDLTVVDIRPDLDVEERELRAQLDRIETEVAEMRKDQRKLIADLRVVLLEEFERGRAALELPRPGQAPASDAPPRRSSRAKGRRATG